MVSGAERLDLAKIARFDFEAPDEVRFPALRLARQALETGGTAPAVLNAANEAAVAAFLGGRIPFTHIATLVEDALSQAGTLAQGSIDDLIALDQSTKRCVEEQIEERCS